jgi:hypothetical protein
MAAPEEINALRRLMESVNKLSASNSASVGKLTTEQQALKQQLELTKHIAERALQMANDMVSRISALEMRLPK